MERKYKIYLQKRQHNESRVKYEKFLKYKYKLISPENKIFFPRNLKSFCKDNKINVGNLWHVAIGNRKHTKGWKAEFIDINHYT